MKKPVTNKKRKIVLKSDLSFEELIDGAFNDKIKTPPKKRQSFKKRSDVKSADGGKPRTKDGIAGSKNG